MCCWTPPAAPPGALLQAFAGWALLAKLTDTLLPEARKAGEDMDTPGQHLRTLPG
jgi:hypothetical protein